MDINRGRRDRGFFASFKLKLKMVEGESRVRDKGLLFLEGCRVFLECLGSFRVGLSGIQSFARILSGSSGQVFDRPVGPLSMFLSCQSSYHYDRLRG